MIKKFILLIAISVGLGFLTRYTCLNYTQAMSVSIFSASMLGTLFFWDFRLSFAFLGTSILLLTKTIDMPHIVEFSSLDVILFLVGMMVLVGLLKETGFFSWLVSQMIRIKGFTGKKFVFILCVSSALLACAIDEVTSIIFIVAAIFEICDYYKVESTPYVIISVLATNIGSAATVLGNPIGILIASKSGLTFEDFIMKAFPLAMVCLFVTIFTVTIWYRKSIKHLDSRIKEKGDGEKIKKLPQTPFNKDLKISLAVFGTTLFFISLHHRLELFLNLPPNSVLFAMPLIASGGIMIWKKHRARKHIEQDVEWWTLLFFLLLFAQAGTLKYTGATDVLANKLVALASSNLSFLTGLVLWIAAIGSSVLDNVVLVAALIPVIKSFQACNVNVQPLWWALLFGGCLGGNITLVGSTANIVALGILEKEKNIRMTFLRWFGVGLTVGIITTIVAWAALSFLPIYR
ncbi:MAG: SLC13 family permease [Candidatus Omnitrophica bacterium]|nr:SLC13 family permease [Candidatus Omnitrophota bacterium]